MGKERKCKEWGWEQGGGRKGTTPLFQTDRRHWHFLCNKYIGQSTLHRYVVTWLVIERSLKDWLDIDHAITFNMEVDDFTAYWERVDSTSISAGVVSAHLPYVQVPLVDVWPHDTESRVVNDPSVIVRQWQRVDVQPSNLTAWIFCGYGGNREYGRMLWQLIVVRADCPISRTLGNNNVLIVYRWFTLPVELGTGPLPYSKAA